MRRLIFVFIAVLIVAGIAIAQPAREKATTTTTVSQKSGTVFGVAVGIPAGKSESDYRFAFSFGGVNPYANPIPGAADKMAGQLGIPKIITQTPQDWNQTQQNTILDGLVARGMRGIFMMPSNAVAANAEIAKLTKAGVPVVCIGGPPAQPSDAVLTLATNVYQSAYTGTMELLKALGGKGNIVGLSGQITDPNTVLRFKGIADAVAKYPNAKLIQKIGDIDEPDAAMTALQSLLAARGNEIDGIVSTAYNPAVALATVLANPRYSHIKGVGQDTDPKVLAAIKDGSLLGTMSQNPWGQGYIAELTLKMLKDGWTYKTGEPFLVDSGSFFIDKANVNNFQQTEMDVTMKLLATWTSRFNPPSK